MLLNSDYLTVGYANDRVSNTEIVGFRGLQPNLHAEILLMSAIPQV